MAKWQSGSVALEIIFLPWKIMKVMRLHRFVVTSVRLSLFMNLNLKRLPDSSSSSCVVFVAITHCWTNGNTACCIMLKKKLYQAQHICHPSHFSLIHPRVQGSVIAIELIEHRSEKGVGQSRGRIIEMVKHILSYK